MNFLQRCWRRRWVRVLFWTAGAIVILIVLLFQWINWSGARQWRATQAMLEAEGETLDFRALANEPVPEAENFCAIPLLKNIALEVDHDMNKGAPAERRKRLEALKLPIEGKSNGRTKFTTAALGEGTDIEAWADRLRKNGSFPMPADSRDAARDVLAALGQHDAIVQELAAGLSRPKAQWTPEWKTRELPEILFNVSLPHYSGIMTVNKFLSLRATAAARTGDANQAHESALIISRLTRANLNEPQMIGLLVAMSGTSFLCGATWELCDAHAGTAEDFSRLEAALENLDFLQGTLRGLRSDTIAGVNALQFIRRRRQLVSGMFPDEGSKSALGSFTMSVIPLGIFDASGAVFAGRKFTLLIKPLRDYGWLAARRASQDWEKEVGEMKTHVWRHPSYIMTGVMGPPIKSILNNAIYAQALVNQAAIACALERHRIKNGVYPDSLDSTLVDGKPLPLDVINGEAMKYRKTANGRYALWSVGFDGKDDGGRRVLDKKNPESTKFHAEKYVGDWVWDFPAE